MISKTARSSLPEDLLLDIFSRLPVKSLLRFRCVSKSLLALIDSPIFVKIHLDKSLKTRSDFDIIFAQNYHDVDVFSLHFCLPHDLNSAMAKRLDFPAKDYFDSKHPCICFIGSCNGILCLGNYLKEALILWNPSTGKYRQVETSKIHKRNIGNGFNEDHVYHFGYNHVKDDYNLVRLPRYYSHRTNYEMEVYSLRMDSWKKIASTPNAILLYLHRAYCVHGAIHWLARAGVGGAMVISAFDLEAETFRLVPMPQVADTWHNKNNIAFYLAELEGHLCMIYYYHLRGLKFSVWVMEEYGVRESWTLLLSGKHCILSNTLAYSNCRRRVLGLGLFETGFPLKWCYLDDDSPREITIYDTLEAEFKFSYGPNYWGRIDACFCLRSLVQL